MADIPKTVRGPRFILTALFTAAVSLPACATHSSLSEDGQLAQPQITEHAAKPLSTDDEHDRFSAHEMWIERATAAFAEDDLAGTEEALRRAMQELANRPDGGDPLDRAGVHLMLGFVIDLRGELDRALKETLAGVALLRDLVRRYRDHDKSTVQSMMDALSQAIIIAERSDRDPPLAKLLTEGIELHRAFPSVLTDSELLRELHTRRADRRMIAGRTLDAADDYRTAARIARERSKDPAQDALLAAHLHDLAIALSRGGRPEEASGLLREAIAIRAVLAASVDDTDLLQSQEALAVTLARLGAFDEARDLLDALIIRRQAWREGTSDEQLAATIANRALIGLEAGEGDAAIRMLQRAIEIRRTIDEIDRESAVALVHNLVALQSALSTQGRLSEALAAAEEAWALAERLGAPEGPTRTQAIALRALAHARIAQDRGAEGRRAMLEALSIMRLVHENSDHPELTDAVVQAAFFLQDLGEHEAAGPLLAEAEARLRVRDDPAARPLRAGVMLRHAMRAIDADDHVRAIEQATASFELVTAHYGSRTHPQVLAIASELAIILYHARAAEQAAEFLRALIAELDQIDPEGSHTLLARLGWILLHLGRPEEALPYLARAALLEDRAITSIGGDALQRMQLSGIARDIGAREGLAWAYYRTGRVIDALETIEADRAQALRSLLAHSSAANARHRAEDPDLTPADLSDIRAMLGPNDALLVYLVSGSGALATMITADADVDTAAFIQSRLQWPDGRPVDAETLERETGRYLAALVRGERPVTASPPTGTTSPSVGGAIRRARPIGHRSEWTRGAALFEALVPEDFRDRLMEKRLVLIIPDGPLHRLPFEALPIDAALAENHSAADQRFWIDEGPMITIAPSATVLRNRVERARLQHAARRRGAGPTFDIVAIGDPVFGRTGPGEARLAPLPGTRREVAAIIELTTSARPNHREAPTSRSVALLGAEATREALRAVADQARVLHIATHGIVESGAAAPRSRVALSRRHEDEPAFDGALTLAELLSEWQSHLEHAELVVLSACDSLGSDPEGRNIGRSEGVFGLPWGFLSAGATSVIASLWPVPDDLTAELMSEFYANWWHAEAQPDPALSRVTAFTTARRALRARHPHPAAWAAFVHIGPGTLDGAKSAEVSKAPDHSVQSEP